MNAAAEWRDDTHDLVRIVADGLIDENFPILVHDADLNDFLMVGGIQEKNAQQRSQDRQKLVN